MQLQEKFINSSGNRIVQIFPNFAALCLSVAVTNEAHIKDVGVIVYLEPQGPCSDVMALNPVDFGEGCSPLHQGSHDSETKWLSLAAACLLN